MIRYRDSTFIFELPQRLIRAIYRLNCIGCGCQWLEHNSDSCGTCGAWCCRPRTVGEVIAQYGQMPELEE